MEYRTLGRTGLRVSAVALGCEGFMHKRAEEVKADFDFAIGHGINFVDIYSSNPDLRANIGAALEGRRGEFIIQGHLCTVWENDQYLRTVFDGPIIRLAQRLKAEGRIRSIGLSSHNPAVARMAVETGLVDVLMFSINPAYDLQPASENVDALWADESYARTLHNVDPERERLYELCERTGVGIDVMKVYGGGDLLSEANSPFGRALTPVQCIEYALTRPAVAAVMVGCKSRAEIEAALAWCGAPAAERDYTAVMTGLERFSWRGHCMYCGHCAPCPKGIDVASVTKFLNLARAQGMVPETVREHYAALARKAGECIACGACSKRCPFGVDAVENMRRAEETFGA